MADMGHEGAFCASASRRLSAATDELSLLTIDSYDLTKRLEYVLCYKPDPRADWSCLGNINDWRVLG